MVNYYVERAKGGAGTIIVEAMYIDDENLFNRLGIFNDRFIDELSYLAASVREHGARVFGQINERGLRGYLSGPDNLSENMIEELVKAYGNAAARVKGAGFNGVEIHGGHGYLINQFLSPLTNHRTDEYGGNIEQRTQFAKAVINAVRNTVGADFPISFRMNGNDYLAGGVEIEDAKVTAVLVEKTGVDLIHVTAGVGAVPYDFSLGNNRSYVHMIQPMALPRGCLVHLAAEIKKVVAVPVITVGRINDPVLAKDILAEEKADLIAMGRQLIADPHFPRKIFEGRIDEIRRCIACNYCHGKRVRELKHIHCAINPWAGREAELEHINKARVPKDIMIVGGGPAGIEAARWFKRRGHRPVIYEKNDRLGGRLILGCLPPHKEEIGTFVQYLVKQVEKMGIELHLKVEVTPDLVLKRHPDVLVIATGGRQVRPDIPIDKNAKCIYAWDVVSGKTAVPDKKVVVLGGGFVAAEIAEFMAEKSHEVTLIEMREEIAFDMEPNSRQLLIGRLEKLTVTIVTKTLIREVTATGVRVKKLEDGSVGEIPAETVVIAMGSEPVAFPVEKMKKAGIKTHIIGDAREINGLAEAVRAGFVLGTSEGSGGGAPL
jgi:2,4-dienoyl-CoA reductase-like NADH-dependent reductase (Old Yellow Enzyme family)/thioredoxin reductase